MAKHSLEKEDLEELIEEAGDNDNEDSEDEDEDENDEDEDEDNDDEDEDDYDDESKEQGKDDGGDGGILPSGWQKFFDESARCHCKSS